MSRSAWRRSWLRRLKWPRGELMKLTWSSTRCLADAPTQSPAVLLGPIVMISFGFVGNGAAGWRQNRPAGEQSSAAQGRDHGEHQKTVPGLCGEETWTYHSFHLVWSASQCCVLPLFSMAVSLTCASPLRRSIRLLWQRFWAKTWMPSLLTLRRPAETVFSTLRNREGSLRPSFLLTTLR